MKLKGKHVLIGVTGGIAAYKVCDLINLLRKEGAVTKVIMTQAAQEFITPLTLESLSGNQVCCDMFEKTTHEVEHISLAHWSDYVIIAPASANTIAKIALGLADNLLTTVVMATKPETKVFIAPAMNTHMWQNKAVKDNIDKLKKRGSRYIIINPRVGRLACGDVGEGPLAKVEDILEALEDLI